MAGARSNLHEVLSGIRGLARALDFDCRIAGSRTLGEEVVETIAVGIQVRTIQRQIDPNGAPLKANRGRYGRRKRAKNLPVGIGLGEAGVPGGDMLSLEQLKGESEVTPEGVTMTYGTDEANRQKAEWFQEGVEQSGQPPRPFYEIDDNDTRNIDAILDETIDRRIQEIGGR